MAYQARCGHCNSPVPGLPTPTSCDVCAPKKTSSDSPSGPAPGFFTFTGKTKAEEKAEADEKWRNYLRNRDAEYKEAERKRIAAGKLSITEVYNNYRNAKEKKYLEIINNYEKGQ